MEPKISGSVSARERVKKTSVAEDWLILEAP
jgi:hypothetical protein